MFGILEIGLHHEQQHQELLITDILHAFAQNPTDPVYDAEWKPPRSTQGPSAALSRCPAGIHAIGHDGEGFCFDNETPRHKELIADVRIARHLVSNADWLEFIDAGGYETPSLWLSDGWAAVQAEGWRAPGYWRLTRRCLVFDDARRPASRSIRPRRSRISAITRPTLSPALPVSICRARRNGRSRRATT